MATRGRPPKLATWLASQHRANARVVTLHAVNEQGGRGDAIHTVHMPDEAAPFEVYEAEFEENAQADADNEGARVKYHVAAATNDGQETGYRAFHCVGQSEDGARPSETASEKGLLSQLMRHNEAQARTNLQLTHTAIAGMTSVNGLLLQQNEKLMGMMDSFIDALRNNAVGDAQRADVLAAKELEIEAHVARTETIEKLGRTVVEKLLANGDQILPALAMRFLQPGPPAPETTPAPAPPPENKPS